MNKKIETTKIKVNSIAEMLAEIRKLKNSGGEWKLLEKHSIWTPGDLMKDYSKISFIISNGTKKVDIFYELDYTSEIADTVLSPEDKKELREIFDTPFFYSKSKIGQSWTVKNFGKDKEIKRASRRLSAWSFNDICKILVDYYQDNKEEIDQSTEKNLPQFDKNEFALSAPWIEVGDDDELFYIWVGERDTKRGFHRGDGELEICLRKSDLVGKYDKGGSKLKDFAGSEGVKKLKKTLNAFWGLLTADKDENDLLINSWEKNVQIGFDSNEPPVVNRNKPAALLGREGCEPTDFRSGSQKPTNSTGQIPNPKLSDHAKEEVRHYMKENDIFQLTLDNGKLVIEYNNSSKKKEEKAINSQQLKDIQDYLKEHNNSVNFEQLKSGSNSTPATSSDKKSDYTLWIAGGIGLFLVVGIFVYWIRKRKNK